MLLKLQGNMLIIFFYLFFLIKKPHPVNVDNISIISLINNERKFNIFFLPFNWFSFFQYKHE